MPGMHLPRIAHEFAVPVPAWAVGLLLACAIVGVFLGSRRASLGRTKYPIGVAAAAIIGAFLAHRTSLVIAATLLLAAAEAAAVNRVLHRRSEELDPASEAPAYTPPQPWVSHETDTADNPRG